MKEKFPEPNFNNSHEAKVLPYPLYHHQEPAVAMSEIEADSTNKTKVQSLIDNISEYVHIYLKLGAVNATEKATVVATVALTTTILSVFLLFTLLFAGLGMAIWLGDTWSDIKAGYFAVAGMFVLLALLFMSLRKKLIFPYLRDHLIKKIYE